MTAWNNLTREELKSRHAEVLKEYEMLKDLGLKLDMTRGKPSAKQLDLANEMLDLPGRDAFRDSEGTDCRNYGILDGIPDAKKLFAPMLDAQPEQVLVGGNASLTLMHDAIWRAISFGVPGGQGPWNKEKKVSFLCPVPGYDRHFAILEAFGIEMISVPLKDDGPDMDVVSELASKNPDIKGIICVPKYSNPTGVVYSDEVVEALAKIPAAAPDFRIFWDNAYSVHHLEESPAELKSILEACEAAGHPNRPLVFASTSKVTLAGAGISFMAASEENLANAKKHISLQTIGSDKINALRHVMFFKSHHGLLEHMKAHARLLKPKFQIIQDIFQKEFTDTGLLSWTNPTGGYFISINTIPGCASRIVALAQDVGVKLTKAGATFPYGKDPEDRNIRLAPSLPPLDEVETAMKAVSVCIKLASLESILAE